jgi:hypothetical protein
MPLARSSAVAGFCLGESSSGACQQLVLIEFSPLCRFRKMGFGLLEHFEIKRVAKPRRRENSALGALNRKESN